MEDTEEKKNALLKFIEDHPHGVFWARLCLWIMCAGVLPFSFIVWRFKLFQTISSIQVGGWGIVAFVILAFVVITILKYVALALKGRYSFVGQCLKGFCKVIVPLACMLLILNSVKSNIDLMIQVLGCVILCEAMAIPLNPLPKWAYEAQKNVREEERKDTVDYLLDGFFKRKEKEHE